MATLSTPSFNPQRLRSYILRLPLFTRACIAIILVFWVLELQTAWNVIQWGSLIPKEIRLRTMYRLNTFPLVHLGIFHALFNVLALTPLLERFEAEHGTLTTLAMFAGPFATLPAGLYIFVDMFILRQNQPILGASVWVFLLLSVEAIKAYRANPSFSISTYKIPTWITPLILAVPISIFVPSASFLGHLCGCAIGYLFGLNYLKILVPPDKILRWIEAKLNLLGRLPHYVSVDQKTYGRYGVLPSTSMPLPLAPGEHTVARGWTGTGSGSEGQRLGD